MASTKPDDQPRLGRPSRKTIDHIKIARGKRGDFSRAFAVVPEQLVDGHAEDLVGDAVGDAEAVDGRESALELLRERAAHEKIPQIDDDAGGDHLERARVGGDEEQGGKLAGGGDHSGRHQEGLEGGQADVPGLDPQREGDGEIPHADGEAVPQAAEDPVPPPRGRKGAVGFRRFIVHGGRFCNAFYKILSVAMPVVFIISFFPAE